MDNSRGTDARKNHKVSRDPRLGRLGVYELEKQSISRGAISADEYERRIRALVNDIGI